MKRLAVYLRGFDPTHELTPTQGLQYVFSISAESARNLVASVPCYVRTDVPPEDAGKWARALREAGGIVDVLTMDEAEARGDLPGATPADSKPTPAPSQADTPRQSTLPRATPAPATSKPEAPRPSTLPRPTPAPVVSFALHRAILETTSFREGEFTWARNHLGDWKDRTMTIERLTAALAERDEPEAPRTE